MKVQCPRGVQIPSIFFNCFLLKPMIFFGCKNTTALEDSKSKGQVSEVQGDKVLCDMLVMTRTDWRLLSHKKNTVF